MTDLERARSELLDIVACAYQGMWTQPLIARVTEILAAARREGAEAERARHDGAMEIIERAAALLRDFDPEKAIERRGAEEMRERAARWLDEEALRHSDAYYAEVPWQRAADAIRALPLTPEEPT